MQIARSRDDRLWQNVRVTRWAWILVAAVACAPARPERLQNPKPVPHPEDDEPVAPLHRPVLLPAPDIDLSAFIPDFHDELRWPLTPMNHPVMEPKFPIAQAFAQPGIGWLELCGSGATNRFGREKELLSYLRGWCKAVDGDTDAACSNLAPLMHSTTPHLEAAVRNDLANILAQGHADKAEHYIRVNVLRDVDLLDLLAANFVEVGTADDAVAINLDAIASDDYPTPATRCLRATKHIVLTNNKTSLLLKEIEQLAKQPKNQDPTCVREYAKLTCWATNECSAFVHELGGTLFDGDIVGDVQRWDRLQSPSDWWHLADVALLQLGTPHNSQIFSNDKLAAITITAMYNAIEAAGRCSGTNADFIKNAEPKLRPLATNDLAQRLDALVVACN